MARGTHEFRIAGYSLYRGLGVGKLIESATFSVGGYDWCVHYYPDGYSAGSQEYVSVFLVLKTEDSEVRALYDLYAVDQAAPPSPSFEFQYSEDPTLFDSRSTGTDSWGFEKFFKRRELKKSPYILDDVIVIECCLTVVNLNKEAQAAKPPVNSFVRVPPPNLLCNLRGLLETQEEADVSFKVKDEVFRAHRIVLAMRSPVFKAELYGPMRDKRKRSVSVIAVEDMLPSIFNSLLHYIYTDELPPMDDLDQHDYEETMKHLLVAADRYAVERMKLMCENILCKNLDAGTVAATLALADQHHCSSLKDACIHFINYSHRMDDVVASQGYEHLKRACPAVFVDIWEKAAKSRKT